MLTEGKSNKRRVKAEKYVDAYIKKYGKPPSYNQVSIFFNVKGGGSAWKALAMYRHKMVKRHFQSHKSPLYRVWLGMKERCVRKNHKHFKSYGGRGISVCKKWATNYILFYNWSIKNGYKKGLWLDRKNNNGNYTPQNCRYITQHDQQKNRQDSVRLIYNGVTMNKTDWAQKVGLSYSSISYRIKRGWDIEDILFKPHKV